MSLAPVTQRPEPEPPAQYDRDFCAWTQRQAALLRAGLLGQLDSEHLAEEIEALGRNEFAKLTSSSRLVLLHMLKWEHQPNLRNRTWALAIAIHRSSLRDTLADNPSLVLRLDEAMQRAYRGARLEAMRETGLAADLFSKVCPYMVEELRDRAYPYE